MQERYIELIQAFAEHIGLESAATLLNEGGVEIDGILCSFDYLPQTPQGKLVAYCDFGPVPDEQSERICRRLLEVNLYLLATQDTTTGAHGVFTLSPETGHVLLAQTRSLENLDAAQLYAAVGNLCDLAKTWQKEHFLMPQELTDGSPPASLRTGPSPF
jgi:hypothetical protein